MKKFGSASNSVKPRITLGILLAAAIVASLVHLGVGGYRWYSPVRVACELLHGPTHNPHDVVNNVVWAIRLPRTLACILVGGILGVVGSAFQAQLRNRLAEPYVIGVSSGAAVGGAIALVVGFGEAFGGLGKALMGFVTGMMSLGLVLWIARKNGIVERGSILLSGVLIGSLLSSIQSMLILGGGQDTNQLMRWLLGSMTPVFLPNDALLFAVFVVGTAVLVAQSRRLNALAYGEATARQLGIDVPRLTRIVLVTGTAMTSVAVGTVGVIGFVGLVAPHIARRVVGVDWRWSLPGSLLCGATILTIADLIAQRGLSTLTNTPGLEPPVGIVTAVVGAPVLLTLLKKRG